jgi:hypothetical protein
MARGRKRSNYRSTLETVAQEELDGELETTSWTIGVALTVGNQEGDKRSPSSRSTEVSDA